MHAESCMYSDIVAYLYIDISMQGLCMLISSRMSKHPAIALLKKLLFYFTKNFTERSYYVNCTFLTVHFQPPPPTSCPTTTYTHTVYCSYFYCNLYTLNYSLTHVLQYHVLGLLYLSTQHM